MSTFSGEDHVKFKYGDNQYEGRVAAGRSTSSENNKIYESNSEIKYKNEGLSETQSEKNFSKSCLALPGKELAVKGYGAKYIYVGITKDDLEEFMDALRIKDWEGIKNLMLLGRLFSIPNGTKVRILKCDDWAGMVKIRILEGDFYSESGWTYTGLVLGIE